MAADRLRTSQPRLRVLFWEGSDPRVLGAIERLADVVVPVVVTGATRAALPRGVDAIEMPSDGVSPCAFAAQLLRDGHADAAVGGAIASSAEFLRAGLKIVGLRAGCRTISTAGIVQPRVGSTSNRPMIFADVGTVPEPTSEQLADIAESTSQTWESLFAEEPVVAFLSSSTNGSTRAPRAAVVAGAIELLTKRAPHLVNLGEVQFDAAVVPAIAARKGVRSDKAGRANVLVFPDLNSANLGYKIAEHTGGAEVVAVTQGFARPWFDLSRGSSVEAIIATAVLAARMALTSAPTSQR